MDSSISSYTYSFQTSVKINWCGVSIAVLLKDCVKAGYALFCEVSKAVHKETSSWCDVSVEITKPFDIVAQKISYLLTSYVQKH